MAFRINDGTLTGFKPEAKETFVIIPDGVTRISWTAFWGNKSIQNVYIPDSVLEMDKGFVFCENLKQVRLSENTVSMQSAFYGCKSLTTVVIPSGVKDLSESFRDCSGLKSVVIPLGVERIELAFASCTQLQSIVVPESVINMRGAFLGCTNLREAEIKGKKCNVTNAFSGCTRLKRAKIADGITELNATFAGCEALQEASIPHSLEIIGDRAFYLCKCLRQVTLPQNLKKIGERAFFYCSNLIELILPDVVQSIGDEAFGSCSNLKRIRFPESLREVGHDVLKGCRKDLEVSIPDWFSTGRSLSINMIQFFKWTAQPEKDLAYIALYQGAKPWREQLTVMIDQNNALSVLNHMAETLSAKKTVSKKHQLAAIDFLARFSRFLTKEAIAGIYQVFKQKGCSDALLAWKKSPLLPDLSSTGQPAAHPVEQLVKENYRVDSLTRKLEKFVKKGVLYQDSQVVSSPMVVMYIIQQTYELVPTSVFGGYEGDQVKWDDAFVDNVMQMKNEKVLERVMDALDQDSLRAYLRELTMKDKCQYSITAYASVATEDQLKALESRKGTLFADNMYKYFAAGAALNSEEFAVRYVSVALDAYSQIRGTNKQDYYETTLADIGFDDDGHRLFDLGGSTVLASLRPDLGVDLYDQTNQKPVKSFYKTGNDPKKVKQARETLSELKKEIRSFLRERRRVLISDFVTGRGRKAALWKATYLQNSALRALGRLLVWQQGNSAFTISGRDLIDSSGKPYVLSDQDVLVAHPVDMRPGEVGAWQQYYLANQLKQPFEQVWEPVVDWMGIKSNRYVGSIVPILYFKDMEEHGINLLGNLFGRESYYSSRELGLQLEGCSLDTLVHRPEGASSPAQDCFILGSFHIWSSENTRQVNHIISLLDRWTLTSRIQRDDASIGELLNRFTLAQITGFIRIAAESEAVKCMALLLEHKNKVFPGIDPMEEFSLDAAPTRGTAMRSAPLGTAQRAAPVNPGKLQHSTRTWLALTGRDGRTAASEALQVGEAVSLVREPDNPYDSNAIEVFNTAGASVGYLPGPLAYEWAPLMDVGSFHVLSAKVTEVIPLSQLSPRTKNPKVDIEVVYHL